MGVWGHASPENFQQMDTKENAIASYLFYPSVLLSVRCNAYEKKKDTTVTSSRRFMQRARLLPFRRARTSIQ